MITLLSEHYDYQSIYICNKGHPLAHVVEEVCVSFPPLLEQRDQERVERGVLLRGHALCIQGQHIRVLRSDPRVKGSDPPDIRGGGFYQVRDEGVIALCRQLEWGLQSTPTHTKKVILKYFKMCKGNP